MATTTRLLDWNSVEEDIQTSLDEIAVSLGTEEKSKPWTDAVLEKLCGMGHHCEFQVCARIPQADRRGWIYDLTWARWMDGGFHEIGLIVESEWQSSWPKIAEDFDKLIVGRAPLRLMIFNKASADTVGQTLGQLKQRALASSVSAKGDRYLLAGFKWNSHGFEYLPFSC